MAGFYFIFPTILFGQKATAFLYHKVGHAVSGVARSIGVPKLQYIAGQHVGVLFTTPLRMTRGPSLQETLAAAYIMCYLLVEAGHFIGLDKSQSTPLICVRFLGFVCDSKHQAFVISQDKRNKFATLREDILSPSFVTLKTIKYFLGEVNFLVLLFRVQNCMYARFLRLFPAIRVCLGRLSSQKPTFDMILSTGRSFTTRRTASNGEQSVTHPLCYIPMIQRWLGPELCAWAVELWSPGITGWTIR